MDIKDMNKLADIIVAKLIALHEECDKEFFNKFEEMNEGYDLIAFETLDSKTINQETDVLLEQLENNLLDAIEAENYKLAEILHKKINDLKNRD